MAYQVIARKYRPQRFSDVVGQEHVTQTLRRAIEQNRIAHAYLFCGPRGTGKTTIARIFAKCLNCTNGPKADFPEEDPRCQEIAEGRSIDVLEIDGASNRGIEEIRELRETVKYAPASSKYKVYIIDEVHMLTKEAFNALLKTLEEPPGHVIFMFATTEPEKVLPTILSRCQRYDLRRIPVNLIVKHLGDIARQEKVQIAPAALQAVARGAEGCMRDAESALDQLISFCGNEIAEEDVLSMFGLAAQGQIFGLSTAILKGEAEPVLRELEALTRHGKDLTRLLSDLLNHFRNLLIFHVAKGDPTMLEATETEGATLAQQVELVSLDALMRIMEALTEAESRIRDAASKKIFLEVALLKAIQARNAVNIDTLLQRLEQLRSGAGGGSGATGGGERSPSTAKAPAPAVAPKAAATAPKPAPPVNRATSEPSVAAPAPAPAPAATPAPPQPIAAASVADLSEFWAQLLAGIGVWTRTMLTEASPVSLDKKTFTIGFHPDYAGQIELVNAPDKTTELRARLKQMGYPDLQVKYTVLEGAALKSVPPVAPPAPEHKPAPSLAAGPARPAATPAAAPAPPPVTPKVLSQDEFKNDPLIQKALEVFKGQIVNVRA